jgi:hypothetical protein
MSNNSIFRVAGIAGILSAILMLVLTFTMDPAGGMSAAYTIPAAALGIVLVAGLYLLYRSEASVLSLIAVAASVIGYLLFAISGILKLTFPNPVLAAGDILIYIVGLSLFSWLAYSTRKMGRPLAIVGFVGALAGLGGYVINLATGGSMTNPSPPVTALYFVYLVGVVVWLAWTGISLLRMKPAAAKA